VLGSFSDADGEALLRSGPGAAGWALDRPTLAAILGACDRLPLAVGIVAGAVGGGGGDGASDDGRHRR
jgi:hypothetical protein